MNDERRLNDGRSCSPWASFRKDKDAMSHKLAIIEQNSPPGRRAGDLPALVVRAGGLAAGAGLVDQLSFAVMRRLDLDDVFTNDRHFSAAGYHVLL